MDVTEVNLEEEKQKAGQDECGAGACYYLTEEREEKHMLG